MPPATLSTRKRAGSPGIAEINRRIPEYERRRAVVEEEEAAMREIEDDAEREMRFENQGMSARRETRVFR